MKRHKTAIFALFIGLFSILLWVACKADTQETQQKSLLDWVRATLAQNTAPRT